MSDEAKKTLASMPENLKRPKGVALQVIGVAMVYNTDVYSEQQPTSWADFWDVEKFPGKRCLPAWPRFVMEAALMADGVAKEDLYPVDMERALKKIEEIKSHVSKWWTTSAQAPQLLLDGEADIRQTREQGYAIVPEGEWREGIAACACAILNRTGDLAGAIGMSGLDSRIKRKQLKEIAPLVMEAARAISTALGYAPHD